MIKSDSIQYSDKNENTSNNLNNSKLDISLQIHNTSNDFKNTSNTNTNSNTNTTNTTNNLNTENSNTTINFGNNHNEELLDNNDKNNKNLTFCQRIYKSYINVGGYKIFLYMSIIIILLIISYFIYSLCK